MTLRTASMPARRSAGSEARYSLTVVALLFMGRSLPTDSARV